jgi:hypothetical protein
VFPDAIQADGNDSLGQVSTSRSGGGPSQSLTMIPIICGGCLAR